jgi:O-6-methylguanine DNA methyltransferase
MSEVYVEYYQSPIGLVEVGGISTSITSVRFVEKQRHRFESHPIVAKGKRQLSEYFDGSRRKFELNISLVGTEFQEQVWHQLLKVPYGHLASYQDIAKAIGRPKATRAVGAANGQNSVAIIVPCHRIIGSNGKLIGYGSGLWRKEWLLKHEGCLLL